MLLASLSTSSKRSLFFGSLATAIALGGAACGDSGSDVAQGGGSCVDNLVPAKNSEFCEASPATIDCANVSDAAKSQVCGVPLFDPPGDLQRSEGVEEFAGSGPPDIACFVPETYPPPPGTSETVEVRGFARIFSNGCESNELSITFFRVNRSGGADDGTLGDQIGETLVTDADCEIAGEESEVDDCDTRWECSYAYPDVPTETELAIRTEGDPRWAPLVQYNIYIPNDEVVDGAWEHDVRALAADDYTVIAQASALGGPITPGNGAVAGEVHDCGDVRLINAVADIDSPRVALTYFTSNEDNPLPDSDAKGTSALGLYAALDVPPGPVTVAAMGRVNGELVSLGQHKVQVFPDAVTSVTFRGLRPYQVPAGE